MEKCWLLFILKDRLTKFDTGFIDFTISFLEANNPVIGEFLIGFNFLKIIKCDDPKQLSQLKETFLMFSDTKPFLGVKDFGDITPSISEAKICLQRLKDVIYDAR